MSSFIKIKAFIPYKCCGSVGDWKIAICNADYLNLKFNFFFLNLERGNSSKILF